MSSVAYLQMPECDPDLIRQASQYGVADLHESMGIVPGRMALMKPEIQALNRGIRIAGQALTVYCYPGDGLLLHKALTMIEPGNILVIANSETSPSVMFAELVALAALQKCVGGVVADGCIRDTEALQEMRFPVWARGFYSGHVEKRGPGAINVPVVCGGVIVEPGDVIVADGDGVISIPPRLLPETIAKARIRAEREVHVRKEIAAGKLLFDLMNFGDAMADVQIHDRKWND